MRKQTGLIVLLLTSATALCAVWLPRPAGLAFVVQSRPGAEAWQAVAGAPPLAGDIELERDRRRGVTLTVPGRWRLALDVPDGGRLRFALQADPALAGGQLAWRTPGGGLLARQRLPEGPAWRDADLDLGALPAGPAVLELAASGPPGRLHLGELRVLRREADPRPNVVLYVIDCLRADHVGAYGYARRTTPRLDALAREGVLFEDVTACAAWTKPSTACLFTSRPATEHGAQTVDDRLDEAHVTLAEAFGAAGYSTAAFVDNPFVSSRSFGLAQGFDRVAQVARAARGANINDLEAEAVHLTRRADGWLRRHSDERFFAYVHSLDLHAAYRWRPGFSGRFARRETATELDLYDGELAANDAQLGALADLLRGRGLLGRTVLAVTADHGEEFGEHGTTRHGASLFQTLLRVPLVVLAPGGPRGLRVPAPVGNVDVAPTLLDLSGVPRPPAFSGLSLRPLMSGRPAPPGRTLVAAQLGPRNVIYAARRGRHKAVRQLLPTPARLLFDLAADPDERRDLSGEAPSEGRALLAELDQLVQRGQTGWHIIVGPPSGPGMLELRVRASGRIEDVQRFSLDLEDRLERSGDGRSLAYRFEPEGQPRHLVLRTAPAGGALDLELRLAGRPVPPSALRVGPLLAPAPAARLEAGQALVPVSGVPPLIESRDGLARVFYVAPGASPKAVIDTELEQSLRALGYIQ
jgi:arylsulfatase A-like enzyme